jgi:hypothetical protein
MIWQRANENTVVNVEKQLLRDLVAENRTLVVGKFSSY